jgi:PHD-finger
MDAPQASNSSTSVAITTADASMTESPPKYVPQFSAATEMILKRINSGVGSTNLSSLGITGTPPGYEDMRRSVLMGMKTSMNMEIPSPPTNSGRRSTGGRASSGPVTGHSTGAFTVTGIPSARQNNGAPASGKGRKRGSKVGQKRKRAKDESDSSGSDSEPMSGLGEDSDSDDTGSVTELPRMTQSGRAVVKPAQFVPAVSDGSSRKRGPTKRTQEHALCKRCGRGHSPASNMIVFCDGCNLGWHQMCHDPAVSDDMVKDESAAWFCADCTLKRIRKGGSADLTRGVSWQGRSTEDVSCKLYHSI